MTAFDSRRHDLLIFTEALGLDPSRIVSGSASLGGDILTVEEVSSNGAGGIIRNADGTARLTKRTYRIQPATPIQEDTHVGTRPATH